MLVNNWKHWPRKDYIYYIKTAVDSYSVCTEKCHNMLLNEKNNLKKCNSYQDSILGVKNYVCISAYTEKYEKIYMPNHSDQLPLEE